VARRKFLLTGLVFLTVWFLLAVATYHLLVIPRVCRFDFYPRWVGARAVLAGENPYSLQVAIRIQEGMFGRQLPIDEDQQGFAYPAYLTWILYLFFCYLSQFRSAYGHHSRFCCYWELFCWRFLRWNGDRLALTFCC
jgi:hypothetical protein